MVGGVFDDAATGQGLLNYVLRAINCGAIAETDAPALSGVSLRRPACRVVFEYHRGQRQKDRSMKILIAICAVAVLLNAQAYRFGKVWDGEKVIDNAVIVVDHGEIQSVGPSDGKVIDMSQYTAFPGLIDVHTHMTYVLDNPVQPRWPWRSHSLSFAGQCEKNSRNRRHHRARPGLIQLRRYRHARSHQHRPDARSAHVRGRLRSADPARPGRGGPGAAHGPERSMKVVQCSRSAAGADWMKMYGSTGSGQDVSGDQTFTYRRNESRRRHRARCSASASPFIPTARPELATRSAPAPIPSNTPPTWTTKRSPKWRARRSSTSPPSITTAITSITPRCCDTRRRPSLR